MGARRHRGVDHEVRHVVRARHAVVHVAAGLQLAVIVVDAVLEERLSDALSKPSVHLAVDDHGVDDVTEVVHGHEIDQPDETRFTVDLHLGDMRSRRVGEVFRVVKGLLGETRLEILGVIGRHVGRKGNLPEGQRLIAVPDDETAVGELHVARIRLEHVRGDAFALGDDLVRGRHQRRPANRQRPRPVGAKAELDPARIAVDHLDAIERHAQTV